IHLYLSVFFAPLLIFYIGTGWYQSVALQRNKLLGEQDSFLTQLTSVHKDLIYPKPEVVGEYSTKLFKVLVVVMSVSLLVTIGLGIFLAFRTSRKAWPVCLCLVVGLLLPVLFLWLGQPSGK
ncbi:MAG: hypothetical protein ACTHMT_07590, partial [Verrucomicrobiota bacterium]